MNKLSIVDTPTYKAAMSTGAKQDHLAELIAGTTKRIEVGDASVISVIRKSGPKRHSLPILISPDEASNTLHKNLLILNTASLRDHEANFMYTATVLTAIWEDETINEDYRTVSRMAANIFVRWTGGAVINRFGVAPADGDAVRIVAAIYYHFQGMRFNEDDYEGRGSYAILAKLAEATGVPNSRVKEIVDEFDFFEDKTLFDFTWYVSTLKRVSAILNDLVDAQALLASITNSWFPGLVVPPQLALQYRPFFIAMLYSAFNDRSASKTSFVRLITNILEGKRRRQGEIFVSAVESIMKAQTRAPRD